jgi:NAD(P)H-hydrate epimerase
MNEKHLRIIGDYLWDRSFAQTVDRLTTEQFHIPADILMENAGRAVARFILDSDAEDVPAVVLAGHGNNGGDALVVARCLFEAGCDVHIFTVGRKGSDKKTDQFQKQLRILSACGIPVQEYRPGCLRKFEDEDPVIVDGVCGIGFSGSFDEDDLPFKALSEAAVLESSAVFAIDIPSGMDVDSGKKQDIPLEADMTFTFGHFKPAQVLSPARDLCGVVVPLEIGFPRAAQDAALGVHRPLLVLPEADELIADDPWKPLQRSAHKFDRGHVLIIGGSAGKTGAPLLAGLAALRSGAGWVTIAMPQSAHDSLRGDVPPELVFEQLFDGERLNPIKLENFIDNRKVRAVIAGPGSVTNPLDMETMAVLNTFVDDAQGFVALDAAATQSVSTLLTEIETDPERWVALPHPGEWRKLGPEFDFVPLTPQGLKKGLGLAEKLGIVLTFKNAAPVVMTGNPKVPAFVLAEGTKALARAGSGDVLSGIIGAHGAIGVGSVQAVLRGYTVLAWAAAIAAEAKGEDAVLATDIIQCIGGVPALLEEEDDDEDDADDD